MKRNLQNDQKEIDAAITNLGKIYKHLENTAQYFQAPNTKRQLSNIMRQVSTLSDQVEKFELQHRQSKKIQRLRLEDERYRTNYNHNTDGRIHGAYYSGLNDTRGKR